MIVGCVIMFDDGEQLLEACLKSLSKVTDRIIVVDGAYAEFPHKDFNSPASLLAVAEKYADKVIMAPGRPWADQVEKRNAYIAECSEGDYILNLDADEKVSGLKPKSKELKEEVYRLKIVTNQGDMNLTTEVCRLFLVTKGLRYHLKHNVLLNAENKLLSYPDPSLPFYPGIELLHTPALRGKERLEKDGVYLRSRKENDVIYDFDGRIKFASRPNGTPAEISTTNDDPMIAVKRLLAMEHYHGFDIVGGETVEILVYNGDTVIVTEEKAKQLLADFPDRFKEV